MTFQSVPHPLEFHISIKSTIESSQRSNELKDIDHSFFPWVSVFFHFKNEKENEENLLK